jgi:Ty3 transposon capsid-like protein/Zinc knuckle
MPPKTRKGQKRTRSTVNELKQLETYYNLSSDDPASNNTDDGTASQPETAGDHKSRRTSNGKTKAPNNDTGKKTDALSESDEDDHYDEKTNSPTTIPTPSIGLSDAEQIQTLKEMIEIMKADAEKHTRTINAQLQAEKDKTPSIRDMKKAVKELLWQPSSPVKISTYLFLFESRIKSEGGTSKQMLELIGQHLTGAALDWFRLLPPSCATLSSWDRFKVDIEKEYHPKLPFSTAMKNLQACKKMNHETYNAHLLRFNNCYVELEANSISHQSLLDTYLHCLPPNVSYELKRSHRVQLEASPGHSRVPPTVAEVSAWAASIDDDMKQLAGATSTPTATSSIPGVSPNYRGKHPKPYYPQGTGPAAFPPGTTSHAAVIPSASEKITPAVVVTPSPLTTPTANQTRTAAVQCFNCGQYGHFKINCTLPPNLQAVRQFRNAYKGQGRQG